MVVSDDDEVGTSLAGEGTNRLVGLFPYLQ